MGSTAYLVHKMIWDGDQTDLPDKAVVYLPDSFCLAEVDASDDEWRAMIHERLTRQFGSRPAQMAFQPASAAEEKELAPDV